MHYNCKEKVTLNNLKTYKYAPDYEYDSDCRL